MPLGVHHTRSPKSRGMLPRPVINTFPLLEVHDCVVLVRNDCSPALACLERGSVRSSKVQGGSERMRRVAIPLNVPLSFYMLPVTVSIARHCEYRDRLAANRMFCQHNSCSRLLRVSRPRRVAEIASPAGRWPCGRFDVMLSRLGQSLLASAAVNAVPLRGCLRHRRPEGAPFLRPRTGPGS